MATHRVTELGRGTSVTTNDLVTLDIRQDGLAADDGVERYRTTLRTNYSTLVDRQNANLTVQKDHTATVLAEGTHAECVAAAEAYLTEHSAVREYYIDHGKQWEPTRA